LPSTFSKPPGERVPEVDGRDVIGYFELCRVRADQLDIAAQPPDLPAGQVRLRARVQRFVELDADDAANR
jgi:hypothetical protein